MAVNRFNQIINPPRFSPLTFEEQSFAPLVLRDREDSLLNAQDEILNQMANIRVAEPYQEMFNNTRQQLTDEMNDLASRIQKEGANNLGYMNEFRNLRNKYNNLVSANGSIGRAANAHEQISLMKDLYMKDAATKGWDAATANRNWAMEKSRYTNDLPEDLETFTGAMPEFNPTWAANKVDLVEKAQEYSELAKNAMDSYSGGTFKFKQVPGVGIVAYDQNDKQIANTEQIDALAGLLERELLNPNSDLNQSMQYQGINPGEYLGDVELLTNMMRKTTKDESATYRANVTPKPTGGYKPAKTKEPGKGNFDNVRKGMARVEASSTEAEAMSKKKELALREDLTETEKEALTTQYNHIISKKRALNNALKTDAGKPYVEEMDKAIADSGAMQARGINNFADYQAYEQVAPGRELKSLIGQYTEQAFAFRNPNLSEQDLDDRDALLGVLSLSDEEATQLIENATPEQQAYLYNNNFIPGMSSTDFIERTNARVQEANDVFTDVARDNYEEAYKELLTDSKFYQLGITDDDRAINSSVSKGIMANTDFDNLAVEGLLRISGEDFIFDPDAPTGNAASGAEEYEDLNMALAREGAKVEFKGVDDGGTTGNPSLMLRVKSQKGDFDYTRDVAIEMDPEKMPNMFANVFTPNGSIYESFSRNGQAILDAVYDKTRYRGVATDLRDQEIPVFTESNTANIKGHARMSITDNGVSYGTLDKNIKDMYFVNHEDTNDYAIFIDGADEAYVLERQGADGATETMTFLDYAKNKGANNAGRLLDNGYASPQFYKYSTTRDILNSIPDQDLDTIGQVGSSPVYNNSEEFKKGLEKAREILSPFMRTRAQVPDGIIAQVSAIFDEYIAPLEVRSRSFKELLNG